MNTGSSLYQDQTRWSTARRRSPIRVGRDGLRKPIAFRLPAKASSRSCLDASTSSSTAPESDPCSAFSAPPSSLALTNSSFAAFQRLRRDSRSRLPSHANARGQGSNHKRDKPAATEREASADATDSSGRPTTRTDHAEPASSSPTVSDKRSRSAQCAWPSRQAPAAPRVNTNPGRISMEAQRSARRPPISASTAVMSQFDSYRRASRKTPHEGRSPPAAGCSIRPQAPLGHR